MDELDIEPTVNKLDLQALENTEDIQENDGNLYTPPYPDPEEKKEAMDTEPGIPRISKREQKLAESKKKINAFLDELGF